MDADARAGRRGGQNPRRVGLGRTGNAGGRAQGDAAGTVRAGSLPISAFPAGRRKKPAGAGRRGTQNRRQAGIGLHSGCGRARRATRRTKPAVRRVTRRTARAGQEYRWKRHNGLTIRGNKWYGYGQSKGGGPADRRPQSTRGASSPRACRHTCRCCRALRPPSRQRALKKHMPQPMVRAHIKWPTAAAESTRGASSPRARRHTCR